MELNVVNIKLMFISLSYSLFIAWNEAAQVMERNCVIRWIFMTKLYIYNILVERKHVKLFISKCLQIVHKCGLAQQYLKSQTFTIGLCLFL